MQIAVDKKTHEKRDKGPFIFYEVGGAGGILGGGYQKKKTALKEGPSKKNKGQGGSRKILPLLEEGSWEKI